MARAARRIKRGPVGVRLGITCRGTTRTTRWARFAGPNLVISHAAEARPQCPESAEAIQGSSTTPAIPAGAYVNVYATNEQIATAIADPRARRVSLTGSGAGGRAVAEIAGRNLKKVVLELGGSDPFILLSSDNLDETVEAAIAGRFENAGQACNAAKRFIVVADVYDDFLGQVHQGRSAGRATVWHRVVAGRRGAVGLQVDQVVADGAESLTSEGDRKGAFFHRVLTNVNPELPSARRNCSDRWPPSTRWPTRTKR